MDPRTHPAAFHSWVASLGGFLPAPVSVVAMRLVQRALQRWLDASRISTTSTATSVEAPVFEDTPWLTGDRWLARMSPRHTRMKELSMNRDIARAAKERASLSRTEGPLVPHRARLVANPMSEAMCPAALVEAIRVSLLDRWGPDVSASTQPTVASLFPALRGAA